MKVKEQEKENFLQLTRNNRGQTGESPRGTPKRLGKEESTVEFQYWLTLCGRFKFMELRGQCL